MDCENQTAKSEKKQIDGAYVLRLCQGKVDLVEERDGCGYGPIGGRRALMDQRDGLDMSGTYLREYVAETGHIIHDNSRVRYLTTTYDETKTACFTNHIYVLVDNSPLYRKSSKSFEVGELLDPDARNLRPWFVKVLQEDDVRNELQGYHIRHQAPRFGVLSMSSMVACYILPDYNPGLRHIYKVTISTIDEEDGVFFDYCPTRITKDAFMAEMCNLHFYMKSCVLIPTDLDEQRNRRLNINIYDVLGTLPLKEGDNNDSWLLLPMHEHI